jgi:hypothetical protein
MSRIGGLENTSYQWLGVNSTTTDSTVARMIFQALGVPDNIGFTNSAHSHCVFNPAEVPYLDAYIGKFLLGQTNAATPVWNVTATNFGKAGTTIDTAKWVNWTVPTLN